MNGNIVAQRGGQLRTRDFAMEALRTVEEGSPGKIVRTFQLSHLLSPIATLVACNMSLVVSKLWLNPITSVDLLRRKVTATLRLTHLSMANLAYAYKTVSYLK